MMNYSKAVEILRKHQGHGAELCCLLASDEGIGRISPPEALATSARSFLFQRAIHLERMGFPTESTTEVRDALNWFGQFTHTAKADDAEM